MNLKDCAAAELAWAITREETYKSDGLVVPEPIRRLKALASRICDAQSGQSGESAGTGLVRAIRDTAARLGIKTLDPREDGSVTEDETIVVLTEIEKRAANGDAVREVIAKCDSALKDGAGVLLGISRELGGLFIAGPGEQPPVIFDNGITESGPVSTTVPSKIVEIGAPLARQGVDVRSIFVPPLILASGTGSTSVKVSENCADPEAVIGSSTVFPYPGSGPSSKTVEIGNYIPLRHGLLLKQRKTGHRALISEVKPDEFVYQWVSPNGNAATDPTVTEPSVWRSDTWEVIEETIEIKPVATANPEFRQISIQAQQPAVAPSSSISAPSLCGDVAADAAIRAASAIQLRHGLLLRQKQTGQRVLISELKQSGFSKFVYQWVSPAGDATSDPVADELGVWSGDTWEQCDPLTIRAKPIVDIDTQRPENIRAALPGGAVIEGKPAASNGTLVLISSWNPSADDMAKSTKDLGAAMAKVGISVEINVPSLVAKFKSERGGQAVKKPGMAFYHWAVGTLKGG